uniref:NADH-ubiquinone oxidoreductase chain 2 n=1 Tax=Staphylinidae sp. 2 EF-2015 TaxID=1759563 RepID=A0A0S2M7G3_9COLE|nr:NADH deshydrogenase subunit 2 [Staphylinidae sp. 2 EF-2015]
MIFMLSLMFSTFISISSNSWMGMWIGLEINLLSIIPLMSDSNNMMSTEASLKYFITQALASNLILFSLISMTNLFFISKFNLTMISMIFNMGLLLKMGAAPLHFWFPEVLEGLNWKLCFLFLTWQKIAPMILLFYNLNFPLLMNFFIISSILISGILGINQMSIRKIMAYSSINHIAWMISSMMLFESIWLMYFLIYCFITTNLIVMFYIFNIYYFKQLINCMNKSSWMKIMFSMNFFSLGGLPPFLGFLPKWLTINMLIENKMILIASMMVIFTLLTLFYYIRLTLSMILLSNSTFLFNFNTPKMYLMFSMNFLTLISLIGCTMIFNWN